MIYLEGIGLWLAVALFFILLIGFVFVSQALIHEQIANEKLKRENRWLKQQLSNVEDKLYRVSFRLPKGDE